MERLQLQEAAFVASILSCPAAAANLAACTAPALPRCALLDPISLKSEPTHSQLLVRRSWRPVRRACVRRLGPVQRDGHCRSQTALPRPCKILIRLSTAALSASSVPPTPPTQTILLALISEYTAPVSVSLHHPIPGLQFAESIRRCDHVPHGNREQLQRCHEISRAPSLGVNRRRAPMNTRELHKRTCLLCSRIHLTFHDAQPCRARLPTCQPAAALPTA